jgi:hypothetical protein
MLECISKRIDEPKDFISLRIVCSSWRKAIKRDAHSRFHPWIFKREDVEGDGKLVLLHQFGEVQEH